MQQLAFEETRSVRLVGELDMSNARELEDALEPAVERGGPVLIELGELTFMDSTGIGALVRTAQALDGRGCIILHDEQEQVRRVLDLVRLEGSLPNLHRVSHRGDQVDASANGSAAATASPSLSTHA